MKGREENEVLDAEESFAIRSYIEAANCQSITGWWFQRFFMFIPTWGNDPNLTNIFQMG